MGLFDQVECPTALPKLADWTYWVWRSTRTASRCLMCPQHVPTLMFFFLTPVKFAHVWVVSPPRDLIIGSWARVTALLLRRAPHAVRRDVIPGLFQFVVLLEVNRVAAVHPRHDAVLPDHVAAVDQVRGSRRAHDVRGLSFFRSRPPAACRVDVWVCGGGGVCGGVLY